MCVHDKALYKYSFTFTFTFTELSLPSCLPHARVLLSACQVWYNELTLNPDSTVLSVSPPDSQSIAYREWALQLLPFCCMAVDSRMGGESSSQHKSSLSNCSQLGQWPGADSFLTASVCVGGMQSHEREWSYTGCAARSQTRFRLVDDSCKNGWSITAVLSTYVILNYSPGRPPAAE